MLYEHLPAQDKKLSEIENNIINNPQCYDILWDYAEELEKHGLFHEAEWWYNFVFSKCNLNKKKENLYKIIDFYLKNKLTVSACNIAKDIDENLYNILLSNADIKKVTVYINCFNTEKYIKNAIESILSLSYPVYELLIIDDGSIDKSREIAEYYASVYNFIKIIDHGGIRKGLAASRNTALYNAKGDFIATIDTDDIADKYWLERLMNVMKNDYIAGAGGKIIELFSQRTIDRWRQIYMNQNSSKEKFLSKYSSEVFSGNNNVFRVEALKAVGGYNPKYFTNYEDMDICLRLKKNGYNLFFEENALAFHTRSDSFISILKTQWNWAEPATNYLEMNDFLKKISNNIISGINRINNSFAKKKYNLIFIDFVSIISNTLNDFKYFLTVNNRNDLIDEIQFYILNAIKIFFEKNNLEISLIDEILSYINKSIIGSYGDKVNNYIAKRAKDNINGNESNIIFENNLSVILNEWINVINTFNFDKVFWSIFKTSFRRIKQEEDNVFYINDINSIIKNRIVLVNFPWVENCRQGIRAGSRWPFSVDANSENIPGYLPFPFFMAYASSLLKKEGFEAYMVDAIAEGLSEEETVCRIKGLQPEIIFIETSTASFHNDIKYARKFKAISPDSKIVFGGAIFNSYGVEIMESAFPIDYAIKGEYEFSLLNFMKMLKLKEGILTEHEKQNIEGLIYRKNSKIFSNNVQKVDINMLPWPERESLNIYAYSDLFAGMKFPQGVVMASRGCPYNCNFCDWIHNYYNDHKYRVRDIEDVIAEVKYITEKFGFLSYYFDDDSFNIGNERIYKLCDGIIKAGINLPWGAMCRADTSSREVFEKMKEAGLVSVKFGVESGNQEIVNKMGKNLSLLDVENAVNICKELGILTHLTFTLGVLGETKETMKETMDFALKLNPDTIQFSICTFFPGTPAYKQALAKDLIKSQEWHYYDGNATAITNYEHLKTEDIELSVKNAYELFRKNKLC